MNFQVLKALELVAFTSIWRKNEFSEKKFETWLSGKNITLNTDASKRNDTSDRNGSDRELGCDPHLRKKLYRDHIMEEGPPSQKNGQLQGGTGIRYPGQPVRMETLS